MMGSRDLSALRYLQNAYVAAFLHMMQQRVGRFVLLAGVAAARTVQLPGGQGAASEVRWQARGCGG